MTQRKYININGEYGWQQVGRTGWVSAQEVMDEMDRLGIWQTVLEYVGASNSLYRAKSLLRDIAALDCPRERIIPSFCIDPSLLFQTGAMDEMIRLIRQNQPCVLSLRPLGCVYSLKSVEEALEKVAPYCRVVMININQMRDRNKGADDLVWLAERFPQLNFVIREFHHNGMPVAYNILRRAKNFYMDIGMNQSMQAVEVCCEAYGAHRVLFGQSLRSGGGASMAAIEYAAVSGETKENIRCRNFIQLFDSPNQEYLTKNLRAIEDKVANSFWRPFIEGKGVTKAELYDSHCHLGYTHTDAYLKNVTFESEIAKYKEDAARFNIKKFVNSPLGIPDPIALHREYEAVVLPEKELFRGYVVFNPNRLDIYTDEYLAERFATGYYVGLKSLPAYVGVDIQDKRYERMFQYAHDHKLAILLHTNGDRVSTPMRCAEMAARYPDCKLILGHSGMGDAGRAECEQIAQDPKYNNVYFEMCATFFSTKKWAESLPYIDYRRILYGTDASYHAVEWELGKLLSEEIPDKEMTAILGQNAKELFGF